MSSRDLRCGLRPLRGAHFGHRVFQHLLIELDADFADMAGLFVAQQVAGAADIEVVAGKRETGAELVQRLHDGEALFRGGGQLRAGGQVR